MRQQEVQIQRAQMQRQQDVQALAGLGLSAATPPPGVMGTARQFAQAASGFFSSPVKVTTAQDLRRNRIKADMSGIDRCPEEGAEFTSFLQELRVRFNREHRYVLHHNYKGMYRGIQRPD